MPRKSKPRVTEPRTMFSDGDEVRSPGRDQANEILHNNETLEFYTLKMDHRAQTKMTIQDHFRPVFEKACLPGYEWIFWSGDNYTVECVDHALDNTPELQGKVVIIVGLTHEDMHNFAVRETYYQCQLSIAHRDCG